MHHVTRGQFGLQDNHHIVRVTSDKDFVLHIWARNVETSPCWTMRIDRQLSVIWRRRRSD